MTLPTGERRAGSVGAFEGPRSVVRSGTRHCRWKPVTNSGLTLSPECGASRPMKFTAVNFRSAAPENAPPTRPSLPDPRRRLEVSVRATRRGRERLARKLKGQRRASPRLPASAILTAAGGAATDWPIPKLDGRMPGRERLPSWNRNESQLVAGGEEISLLPLKPKDSTCHLPW